MLLSISFVANVYVVQLFDKVDNISCLSFVGPVKIKILFTHVDFKAGAS